jgi:hypothetical protein
VFLETKIWISDYGYDKTLRGFEKSARKLGVDQIDLLILHQALASKFDSTLEAYRALDGITMSDPEDLTLRNAPIGDFAPKLVSLTDDLLFGDAWQREELPNGTQADHRRRPHRTAAKPSSCGTISCWPKLTDSPRLSSRGDHPPRLLRRLAPRHFRHPGRQGSLRRPTGSPTSADGYRRPCWPDRDKKDVMNKLLVPSSALLWGLQLAFLSPALALILVNLYGATTAEVGWVLGIYNASGFIASLLLPAYADKKHDYLGPMLVCGALTLLLAVVLALATTLPTATIALVVIGGPAGVGSSLLFAHLRHLGARPSDIVNTRAIVSVAWVAGPPLATFILGWFGNRAILVAVAAVAVLNMATTAIMISHRRQQAAPSLPEAPNPHRLRPRPMSHPSAVSVSC